jgi:hypothetical protein
MSAPSRLVDTVYFHDPDLTLTKKMWDIELNSCCKSASSFTIISCTFYATVIQFRYNIYIYVNLMIFEYFRTSFQSREGSIL